MTECSRKNKWFRGCHFEPRYDVQEPSDELVRIVSKQWASSSDDKELLVVKSTYVHDICTVCGRIATVNNQ